MPAEAENLRSTIQSLLTEDLGWTLRFPYHEDGSELQPFLWDEATQGSLTALNLLRSHQWIRSIEVSQVLATWLQPEQVGAVNGATWLIPDQDRAGILLDAATQTARQQQYAALLQACQSEFADLRAWAVSYDEEYQLVVLLGQVTSSETAAWIGIAPVVPIATPSLPSPIQSHPMQSSDPAMQLSSAATQWIQGCQSQIDRLGKVQLYGYYGGGYDQTHDYHLVQAMGETIDRTLEQTLMQTGLWTIGQFGAFSPDASADQNVIDSVEQLNQFLQQHLSDCRVYQFHFWNQEQLYVVGRANGTWIGVELSSRFTYNP